jgi:hypothetical protein
MSNNYFIAFSQAKSEGNVIAYGYTPNPIPGQSVSGSSPLGSEETYADFTSYQARLAVLGFEVSIDPALQAQTSDS